jgi:hypothetical protein
MPVVTYYAERARRDPTWRRAQIAAARERYERAKAADPDRVREWSRRYRERLRAGSMTFAELRRSCLLDNYPDAENTLRRIIAEEVRAGRVEIVQRRLRLNGAIDEATKQALAELEL